MWDRSSVADSSFAFSGIHPKDIDKVKNIDDVLMEVKHVISKMACEAQLCKILRNLLIIQAHKRYALPLILPRRKSTDFMIQGEGAFSANRPFR